MKKVFMKWYRDAVKKTTLFILSFVLATVVLTSCGRESEIPEDTIAIDKPVHSSFLNELSKNSYPEVEPPPDALVFKWDFSSKQTHSYTYEQEAKNKMDIGSFSDAPGDTEQTMWAKGDLLIKSQGDHTADFVLKDTKMGIEMNLGDEEGPKTVEQTAPPMAVHHMKEDGSLDLSDSSEQVFLGLLFPLPSQSLRVGESTDVPAQAPFDAMGSLLQVKGRSRITLTKYVKIGEQTCAQFDTDIDISELEIPPELKGDYSCSTRGASVFYFDIVNRRFVSGTIAILMQISIEAPMPQTKMDAEKMPDPTKRVMMSMKSDNLIQVALKK